MKDFLLSLTSSNTLASSKRFLLILFGLTLVYVCIYEVMVGEYVLPTTTLAGLIATLAGINMKENLKNKEKIL